MPDAEQRCLLLILVIGVLAPLLADRVRALRPPVVVLEILLGILVGPQVLGWAEPGPTIEFLSHLGLVSLFFHAGFEIDFRRIWGRPLGLASAGWLLSLTLAFGVAWVLEESQVTLSVALIAIALTTTALGTLMPILRDAGELETPFGSFAVAAGAMGEFGPIVLISVLLTAHGGGGIMAILFLLFLMGIALAGAVVASRARPPYFVEALRRMTHSSSQLPVRLSVLVMAALVVLTNRLGLDAALGAIAGGIIIALACRGEAGEVVVHKLEGIGFGLFIPIFFIVSGMRFNLAALLSSTGALARLPLFLVLFLLVRGLPVVLYRKDLPWRDRAALALLSATALPLVVAITEIGLRSERMRPENAAALVGAGMVSVLLFPLAASIIRTKPPAESLPCGH